MNYKIEECGNADRLVIHISKKLDVDIILIFNSDKTTHDLEGKEIDENLKYLACALFQIVGINEIIFHPYDITFDKGKCFEWNDLIPAILKTIDVMLATNEEFKELPRIRMTEEERNRLQRQAEEWEKRFGD